MRLTPAEQAKRYEKVRQHLSQLVDEATTRPSIASRMYPHLRQDKSVDEDQPNTRPPIQGWSHLQRKGK